MFTLWRICSKAVDYFDREANEDKRCKREIPLLLLVAIIVVVGVAVSMGVGYLSGESPFPQPIP